jgi:hypothetical protein
LPDDLVGAIEADHHFGEQDPAVYLARRSGPVTLVLFDGEHDFVFNAALRWVYDQAGGDVTG